MQVKGKHKGWVLKSLQVIETKTEQNPSKRSMEEL